MHVREPRAFGGLEEAQRHIAACEVFATEFDFIEADQAALERVLAMPEGATLDGLLSPGAWKSLLFYNQKKIGLPEEVLRRQHPMTTALLLNNALLNEEAPASLDETLWQHAQSLGKPTTGVESFAEQLAILKKIPLEVHVGNLTALLKNYRRQKNRVKKMLKWYAAGDISQLYRSAKRDARGLRKLLLYKRNRLMVKRFLEIAEQQSLFCAVGAGHLAGEKGMLRLLKKAGCRVTPL